MKKIIFSAAFMLASVIVFAKTTTATVKVWGNCDMCKDKIEAAAKKAGATKADWSEETHQLRVTFDDKKTSGDRIQKNIAGAGYDTEKFAATDAAYGKLPGCCKYDRKPAEEVKQ